MQMGVGIGSTAKPTQIVDEKSVGAQLFEDGHCRRTSMRSRSNFVVKSVAALKEEHKLVVSCECSIYCLLSTHH